MLLLLGRVLCPGVLRPVPCQHQAGQVCGLTPDCQCLRLRAYGCSCCTPVGCRCAALPLATQRACVGVCMVLRGHTLPGPAPCCDTAWPLSRFKFGLPPAEASVLRSYLSPEVEDGEEHGWEEMTEVGAGRVSTACVLAAPWTHSAGMAWHGIYSGCGA